VSLLVCRSEVADNCLQLIQIECCKENHPLISFVVDHVVRKGNAAKRKPIHCIKNARKIIAQFQLGLKALKNEHCKAFQRLRKAGGAAKDDAKHTVQYTVQYTVHSQHRSLCTCPLVSQLPLGIEMFKGVMADTSNYMTWPLQVLSPMHVVSNNRTGIAYAQCLALCEQNSTFKKRVRKVIIELN